MPLYKRKYPRWHERAWKQAGIEEWVKEGENKEEDQDME